MTRIKPQEIEALVEAFDNSPWQEMRLKVEGFELFYRKRPGQPPSQSRWRNIQRILRRSPRRTRPRFRRPLTFQITGLRCARRTLAPSIAPQSPAQRPMSRSGDQRRHRGLPD
jgi:hypothetical protein